MATNILVHISTAHDMREYERRLSRKHDDGKNRNFWREGKAEQAPPGRLFRPR